MGDHVTRRTEWVDVAKCLAILAVLVDHTYNTLYTNVVVRTATSYSIGLFILMMGITSYWSYQRYQGSVAVKVRRSCWKLICPYIVASMFYGTLFDRTFHLAENVRRIVFFYAVGPFYYVCLYLQLLLVVPVLYLFLQKADQQKHIHLLEVLGFVVVVVIAGCTTNYSNILDLYGGGGKLFGGTYLCLLYLGMWFGKYCRSFQVSRIISLVCFLLG